MQNKNQSQENKRQSRANQPPERRQMRVGKLVYDVVYIDRNRGVLGRQVFCIPRQRFPAVACGPGISG